MEPTEGQEPAQPETTPDPTPPPPKTFDESYVKELRSEAAKYRKTAKEYEARMAEIEAAQEAAEAKKLAEQGEYKTLAEKARAEADQLRQELEAERARLASERVNNQALAIAASLGVIDPTDANVLAAVAGIDPASENTEAEIKTRIEGLKETRPYLFGTNRPGLSSFNPTGQPNEPALETDEARRARLNNPGSNFFNFENEAALRAAGGGVIWPKGKPD
jgi:multidrug efflux pump subunit AcrA (membrane-fusion protein)